MGGGVGAFALLFVVVVVEIKRERVCVCVGGGGGGIVLHGMEISLFFKKLSSPSHLPPPPLLSFSFS